MLFTYPVKNAGMLANLYIVSEMKLNIQYLEVLYFEM